MSFLEANSSQEWYLNGNICLERFRKLNFISSEAGFSSYIILSKLSLFYLLHSFLRYLQRAHQVLSYFAK